MFFKLGSASFSIIRLYRASSGIGAVICGAHYRAFGSCLGEVAAVHGFQLLFAMLKRLGGVPAHGFQAI